MRDIKPVIYDNIRTLVLRRYGRLSKRGFARDAGIGLGTAQRLLDGDTVVGIDVLQRVAHLFGLEPAALLQPALGATGLSAMAQSLGADLDLIADPAQRRTVWALCLLVIDRRGLPEPMSVRTVAPAPAPAPGRTAPT